MVKRTPSQHKGTKTGSFNKGSVSAFGVYLALGREVRCLGVIFFLQQTTTGALVGVAARVNKGAPVNAAVNRTVVEILLKKTDNLSSLFVK